MSSNKTTLQNIGIGLAVGLIVGGTGTWLLAKSRVMPAASKSACFLSSSLAGTLFGSVDNKDITSENLPQDAQAALLQVQSEYNRKLGEILNDVAVRYQAAKEQGKATSIESLPGIRELSKANVNPEDVRKFYETNKKSFPKMEFAQVESMLRRHLEQQQQNTFLQGRLLGLKNQNLFKSAIAVPCGPKALASVPETALRNSKPAKFDLVFVTDYQCGPCRYMKEGLKTTIDMYKDSLSLAQVVYAGPKKNSSNEYMVRGLFCAKSVGDENKQLNYHDVAYFSNIKYDNAGAVVEEANLKSGAMEAAKRAGINDAAFASCLDSKEAEAFVEAGRKYVIDSKLEQAPAFFLNGRRLAVPPQLNVGEIVGEIVEEVAPKAKKPAK